MDTKYIQGSPFNATASNATSATASVSGQTGKIHYITDISGGVEAGTAILELADGSTKKWQMVIGTGGYDKEFIAPIAGSSNSTVSVTVYGGSGNKKANIAGYTL